MSPSAPDPPDRAGIRGVAALVTANASLALGTLFYMGWAYANAWLGYFHINPLDLEIGVTEYALRGLNVFGPFMVFGGVAMVILISLVGGLRRWRPADHLPQSVRGPIERFGALPDPTSVLLRVSGTLVLLAIPACLLLALAGLVRPTYPVLLLLGIGPVLLSRPDRDAGAGRFAYSAAIVLAAVCGLWAAGLYAQTRGVANAEQLVRDLPGHNAVVVYSARPLALSGLGLSSVTLPKGYRYGYRYEGLRLLIARSNRYYLLPVNWRPGLSATYVIPQSDDIRVELLPGSR